jgi:hypothetical protein
MGLNDDLTPLPRPESIRRCQNYRCGKPATTAPFSFPPHCTFWCAGCADAIGMKTLLASVANALDDCRTMAADLAAGEDRPWTL